MESFHCHTCNKELNYANMAYEYCSWRCFINRNNNAIMTCREIIIGCQDFFPPDIVYVIYKYLPKTVNCYRCKVIYNIQDGIDRFCSHSCYYNVDENELNECIVCNDIFVDNGWGDRICSRRCDMILDR